MTDRIEYCTDIESEQSHLTLNERRKDGSPLKRAPRIRAFYERPEIPGRKASIILEI